MRGRKGSAFMASISSDSNGTRRIQFIGADGKRRAVRLGKASLKQAEALRVKMEHLVSAVALGQLPDPEIGRWLVGLDDVMHNRLAAVGLVAPRQLLNLAAFLDGYIDGRSDLKESTKIALKQTRRDLVEFFGADKALQSISEGDADEWRQWLSRRVSSNTVRRRCGRAKQFFGFAVRKRAIVVNPFTHLESSVQANASRQWFISREHAQWVLDACPDAEWRLLFALSRYGGLRCPSEHLALKWADVDWDRQRLHVRSPKTEHHEGKAVRVVPLFPELRPYLLEVFEEAAPGAMYVISTYRMGNVNLRTRLKRIIRKAGLEPWAKLFQNLRSTRETELADRFPVQAVCAWIGNSEAVAKKHYLQVTEQHFTDAVREPEQAAQKAAQHGAESGGTDKKGDVQQKTQAPSMLELASSCVAVRNSGMASEGLEPSHLLGNGF